MIQIKKYQDLAKRIMTPIKLIDNTTVYDHKKLLISRRSKASYNLPSYQLVYFLFNDLLELKNTGREEKVAWSFPIDYKGKAFLIDHRKFGVGIFIQDDEDEVDANELCLKIKKAVSAVGGYFDYVASEAVKSSKFSVVNHNSELYNRFDYLLNEYKVQIRKYKRTKNKFKKTEKITEFGKFTSSEDLSYMYIPVKLTTLFRGKLTT